MASIQEFNITSCQNLANKLIQFLINNGMVMIAPSGAFNSTIYKATLKSTNIINSTSNLSDPLSDWYFVIDANTNSNKIRLMVGTSNQFGTTDVPIIGPTGKGIGQLAAYNDPTETCADCIQYTVPAPPTSIPTWTVYEFIDRSNYTPTTSAAFPLSYAITTSSQGIALAIWEEGTDEYTIPTLSYAVIQHSVNNRTGIQQNTGKQPIFCFYGINRPDIQAHYKFVVKEQDVFVPNIVIRSDRDSIDGTRSINSHHQVAIMEDFNYAIFFPNNLHTERFTYPQNDIDLIAYTSADVISASNNVTLPVYNEPSMRTYKSLPSTGIDQTGMRILILLN